MYEYQGVIKRKFLIQFHLLFDASFAVIGQINYH